ncbi:MAG: NUDIX hydrolase [bacterium]
MNELNEIQMQILKHLLFAPNSRFKEMNIGKIPTDQFSYHLRCLSDLNLIQKENTKYSLTTKGKEFANLMDTDKAKIEKQPKVSVLLIATREAMNGIEILIGTRLKEPFYGYKGFITGKIRFGETIEEAAERELMEETSLHGKYELKFTFHDMVYSKSGEILEDKLFFVVGVTNVSGELVNAKGGEHHWLSEAEFKTATPKYYDEDEIYAWFKSGDNSFKENKYYIDEF